MKISEVQTVTIPYIMTPDGLLPTKIVVNYMKETRTEGDAVFTVFSCNVVDSPGWLTVANFDLKWVERGSVKSALLSHVEGVENVETALFLGVLNDQLRLKEA